MIDIRLQPVSNRIIGIKKNRWSVWSTSDCDETWAISSVSSSDDCLASRGCRIGVIQQMSRHLKEMMGLKAFESVAMQSGNRP